ncbi:MAG: YabP/YqfC family sporulation protein [Clostridia bacterium]|nr:YabP/YqfC family sporulation protein [Clostridia bacterium]
MEHNVNPATAGAHVLTLEGRSRARLSGVSAVCCFNEREIVLETSEGEVALLGEGMHIGQLNLQEGMLDVTGEITGIEYNGPVRHKGRRGLFAPKKR